MALSPDDAAFEYDEFGLFADNCAEVGLAYAGPPAVRRESVIVEPAGGRRLSALVWGPPGATSVEPEFVFVHGGAQNAHTWDTTVLALGRSAVCVDLPGHGHSDWRDDQAYDPVHNADDVAAVIRALAPSARVVVGMSLGGLTSIALAAGHPDVVPAVIVVDVTPGVTGQKAKAILDFVNGPQHFDTFDSLLARTAEHNPTRTESSLRRGILHNATRNADGTWRWRYDRRTPHGERVPLEPGFLWDELGSVDVPAMLLRGSLSPVVDDADVAEFRRRLPHAGVVVVRDAGHSIQGDQPVALAGIIEAFLAGTSRTQA